MSEETPVLPGKSRFLVVSLRSTPRNDTSVDVVTPMHLQSQIVILRSPEDVGRFLSDVSNISKWDRGVSEAKPNSYAPMPVGSEFETLAPAALGGNKAHRGRMAYRFAEVGKDYCKVQLTNSDGNARFFKTAEWKFQAEPAGDNTVRARCGHIGVLAAYPTAAPGPQ